MRNQNKAEREIVLVLVLAVLAGVILSSQSFQAVILFAALVVGYCLLIDLVCDMVVYSFNILIKRI